MTGTPSDWTCGGAGCCHPHFAFKHAGNIFCLQSALVQGIDVAWTSNFWFAVVRFWPQSFAEPVSLHLCLRRWPGPFCFLRNFEPLHVRLCSRVIVVWLFVPIRGVQQLLQCAMSLTQNYNER